MTTEEKILDSQQIALPLPDNIGITQSSGLDHHAVFSRQRVDVFKDEDIASTKVLASTKMPPTLSVSPLISRQLERLDILTTRELTTSLSVRISVSWNGPASFAA